MGNRQDNGVMHSNYRRVLLEVVFLIEKQTLAQPQRNGALSAKQTHTKILRMTASSPKTT